MIQTTKLGGWLLFLLAVPFVVPSSALAQRLPSVWEPGEWVDQNSLAKPAPQALLWISGSGGLAGRIDQEKSLDYPPAIRLLGDEAFRRALCGEGQATGGDALDAVIERAVTDYKQSFEDLISKLSELQSPEEKGVEIKTFKRETSRALNDLRNRLTPSQQERCERRYASIIFYWHGPVEFARRMDADEKELAEIRARVFDLPDTLRTRLREVETATLLEALDMLDGRGIEEMRALVKSAGPKRQGVLFTLHDDLTKFDPPPISLTKTASAHMTLYRLGSAGTFVPDTEVNADPFLDAWGLFSAQEIDSQGQEATRRLLNKQFSARLNQDSEDWVLSRKKDELRSMARDKNNDMFQIYAKLAEVETDLFELRTDQAEAVLERLSDDGRREVEKGRLLFYMQRYGCTGVLASKFAHDRFGLSIEAASWQALDAEAPKIAASLRARAVEVQQEIVKGLYRDTSLAGQFEKPWASVVEGDYVPPLETLSLFNQKR